MATPEERRFTRRQLRELKEDVDSLERKLERQVVPPDQIFDAVRRLIENRVLDLWELGQADD